MPLYISILTIPSTFSKGFFALEYAIRGELFEPNIYSFVLRRDMLFARRVILEMDIYSLGVLFPQNKHLSNFVFGNAISLRIRGSVIFHTIASK